LRFDIDDYLFLLFLLFESLPIRR